MSEPALWFSTEDMCEVCNRPKATAEHLERWARDGMRTYNIDGVLTTAVPAWSDGTRDEPLWAARLCWTTQGARCGCDPGKVRARIRFLEITEDIANERAKVSR